MRKSLVKFIIISILIIANTFLIIRAYDVANSYPFSRVILGDELHYSSVLFEKSHYFGAKIISINNSSVKNKNIINEIIKNKDNIDTIELVDRNGLQFAYYYHEKFNYNIFSLFIILILFGNIHLIWALMVRHVHPNFNSSRLYSNYSLSVGILFFSAVTYLMLNGYPIYLYCSIMLISYLFNNAGIEISNIRNKDFYNRFIALITTLLLLVMISFFHLISIKNQFVILHALILLSTLNFVLMFVSRALSLKRSFLRTATIVIIIFFIGVILPVGLSFYSLFYDFIIPIHFFSAVTLMFPMIVGNNLINENNLNSYSLKRRYLTKFFIDSLFSLLAAYSFYFLVNLNESLLLKILYYVLFSFNFLLIFVIRKRILEALNKKTVSSNEIYTQTLKDIVEIASSQRKIKDKLKKILKKIYNTIDTGSVRIALFDSCIDEKIDELKRYVDYLDDNSHLVNYYKVHYSPIKKNSLLSGWNFEEIKKSSLVNNNVELVIPINVKGKICGVMIVNEKKKRKIFNQNEVKFFNSVAPIIYHMFINEILFRNFVIKRKYERELDVASYIQMRLFPKYIPFNKGVNIAFYNRPYIKVTGDYFDFVELDSDRTAFIISDVSGHGLAAAMMLSIVGSICIGLFREGKSIKDIVQELNDYLTKRYQGIELITFFIAVYNKSNREFRYINAGHCLPLVISADEKNIYELKKRNHILGVDENTDYKISKQILNSRDEVILYTDGLTELYDQTHGGDIGEKILYNVINDNLKKGIEEKIDGFRDYIDKLGVDAIKDDITIVGIKID